MTFGKIALKILVFSLSVVFILTATLFSPRSAGAQANAAGVLIGAAAPDFELKDLADLSVKLSKYKGQKPVLLYFWATWCPYCMAARPGVIKLRNDTPQAELELLAVNVGGGDSLARVKKFEEAHPAPFTVLYDGETKVTRAYQVQGIPLFVVVDKSGVIKYRSTDLPPDIKKLLK
jgi:peroxiredoxin